MWNKNLDRNNFLTTLYNNVPPLKNIRIAEINIFDEGQVVAISFDMPSFADYPPKKWLEKGYNSVAVRLDFSFIKKLDIKAGTNDYRADVEIYNDNIDNLIVVKITGTINALIKAELGFFQSVTGYCNSETRYCSID